MEFLALGNWGGATLGYRGECIGVGAKNWRCVWGGSSFYSYLTKLIITTFRNLFTISILKSTLFLKAAFEICPAAYRRKI